MVVFSTEDHIIDLGARIAATHEDADKRFRSGWFVTGYERRKWVEFVNETMRDFPKLIQLRDGGEIALARYADGRGKIDKAYKPLTSTVQFLIGLATGHPVSAGWGFWRLLRHGGVVAAYDKSSPINRACASVLSNYALVSVSPEGCALVKGEWYMSGQVRDSYFYCRAGLHLDAIVEIDATGDVYFIKDFYAG
jgi:hypothetical protein